MDDTACRVRHAAPIFRSMNVYKAILFTLISSLMFAAMSALVRSVGESVPVGQVVFFRAAFAIVPITLIVLFRGELLADGPHPPRCSAMPGAACSASAACS